MTNVAESLELDPASASWRVTKKHPSWMSEVRLPYRRATRCREHRRKDVLRMDDAEVAFGIVRGIRTNRPSGNLVPRAVNALDEEGRFLVHASACHIGVIDLAATLSVTVAAEELPVIAGDGSVVAYEQRGVLFARSPGLLR